MRQRVATVIADSVTSTGDRLSTLELRTEVPVVLTAGDFSSLQQVATTPLAFTRWDLADAQDAIADALAASTPTLVLAGGVHLPYVSAAERRYFTLSQQACIAVARCVRAGEPHHPATDDPGADIALYQRLISAAPPLMSATEHVALPALGMTGRFAGWVSLRHLFEYRGVASV